MLAEEAHKAARVLMDHAYVRLLARDEPDAVCAASLLAHALRRENVDVHASWLPRLSADALETLQDPRADCAVLIGLAGDAAPGAVAGQTIVLDRRASLPAEASLDPAHLGAAGEASLSALAHLVAVAVSKRNRDLSFLAATGANAARTTLTGLDAEILAEAAQVGAVARDVRLDLKGPTLLGALSLMDEPYVAGVSGRARNVRKLVGDLHLAADAPPSSLDPEAETRLGSLLTARLLQQGAPDAAIDALYRPRVRALAGPHTGLEAGELASLVEAACAVGKCGLAFVALWPEPSGASELDAARQQVRDELVATLLRAERDAAREGPLVVVDAPRDRLCLPLALRLSTSLVPEGSVAVARHVGQDGATLVLRGGGRDVGAAARHAATVAGGLAIGDRREARVRLSADDDGRFLKAVAEALT